MDHRKENQNPSSGATGLQRLAELESAVLAAQARAEQYRHLLDSIDSPVLALAADLTVLYANEAYAHFIGQPGLSLEGRLLTEVVPEFTQSPSYAAYQRVLATGEAAEVEETVGEHLIRVRVYRTAEGLLALAEDVTARQAMEVERERLVAELQDRTAELSVLNELARDLTVAHGVREVAERVYYHASRLMDTTNFGIATYDPIGDEITFVLQVTRGQMSPPTNQERRRARRGLTEYVIHSRQPLWLPDRVAERRAALGLEAFGTNAQCWLGVPLITGDRVLGAIFVQSYTTERLYSERERELLWTIADQAAVAFEGVRFFQERERRITELSILTEVGRTLALGSLRDLPDKILEQVSRVFDVENFFIAYYEEGSPDWELVLDVEHGVRQPLSRYPLTAGVTGYILRHRRPLLFSTSAQLQAFMDEQGIGRIGEVAKSWLGVPLMMGERVLGVMGVQSYTQEFIYSEQDLALLSTIGSQLAAVLENARLFQTTQQALARAQTLYRASRSLNAWEERGTFLQTVTNDMASALNVDGVLVFTLDTEKRQVLEVAGAGPAMEKQMTYRPTYDELWDGLTGWALRENRPAFAPKGMPDPRESSEAHRRRHALGLGSTLVIPLVYQGESLGVLVVTRRLEQPDFTADEQEMMIALGTQMTAALANMRLLTRTRAERAQAQTLYDISRRLAATTTQEEIIRVALGSVNALGAQHGDLLLLNVQGQPLFRSTIPERAALTPEATQALVQQLLTTGVQAWVLAERRAALVTDTETDSRWLKLSGAQETGPVVRSALCVPLFERSGAIGGMLTWAYAQPQLFSASEVALAEEIAARVTVALENARLLEQAQLYGRREQRLREITARVRGSIDPDSIVRTAVRELGTALGRKAFVHLGEDVTPQPSPVEPTAQDAAEPAIQAE